jgi:hypothetical protein
MEPSRPFDRTKDCVSCLREIDEVTVRLKKLTVGGDTYRRYDPKDLAGLKYEKICVDCFFGKPVYFEKGGENDLL